MARNEQTDKEMTVEFEAAVKFIRASRNRKIFIMGSTLAPSKEDADKGYSLGLTVPVSAPVAIEVLKRMYEHHMHTKALVRLHDTGNCLFVGSIVG